MFEKPPEQKINNKTTFEGLPEQKIFKSPPELYNVKETETKSAQYRLYYDSHYTEVGPEILKDADALLVEFAVDFKDNEQVRKYFAMLFHDQQFGILLREAAKKNLPVFFVDMLTTDRKDRKELDLKKDFAPFLEMALSTALLTSAAVKAVEKIKSDEPVSRRDFLKGGLKMLGAAYFAAPFAQGAVFEASIKKESELLDEKSLGRRIDKQLDAFNYLTHPELRTVLTETRNDIFAEKAEYVAAKMGAQLGRKPKLAFVLGAKHSGVERSLQDTPEARVARIKHDLKEKTSLNAPIAKIDLAQGPDSYYYSTEIWQDENLKR